MNNCENPMKSKSILPLLITMSVPPMVSMMIQSLYNIVDSIFVAQIGEKALTAVSLVFPLQNIVLALAIGFGVGLNSTISISLGANDNDKVNEAVSHGIVLSLVHWIIFIMVGIFLTKPFLRMFTSDEEIFNWGYQYAVIVMCFSAGVFYQLVLEKMYQALGNMIIPMAIQIAGCIINIVLDPVFIFGMFGMPAMGVLGAAIATVIGQISAFILYIIIFRRNNNGIKISIKKFRFDRDMVKKLYSVGLPSSVMMAVPSVLVGVLNGILINLSQSAVAFIGIYFKLQTFVYMPANGLLQGMRPIVGYNYGAREKERMFKAIKASIFIAVIIMAIGTFVLMIFPSSVLNMFNAESELMTVGISALKIISTGFIFSAIPVVFSGVFEGLGDGMRSLIITLLRQLIIIVPAAILLSKVFGIYGVWISFPLSEIAAMVISIIIMKSKLREIEV
ncbi:MATE family efflux transporter [uncultured Clostridium sp.]|uniref:MATE family efflux transporter n=1 Tax=uncultured Clostridium sp. TaxID=59620 RepID=UPI0025F84C09|nr:MATE family efflux transporter [uncultured Clostridium sp.]